MLFIKYILTYIGCKLVNPVWSFPINLAIWLKMFLSPKRYREVKARIKELRKVVKTLSDLDRELVCFSWRKDRWFDWVPWISVFLYRSGRDDCDGAATFTCWLAKLVGLTARKVTVISKKFFAGNHAVALISETYLYSNGVCVISKWNPLDKYVKGGNEWKQEFYKRTV